LLEYVPGDGEAAALQIELLHDGDVFLVTMIGIASYVAGVCAFYFADGVGKRSQMDSPLPSSFQAPSIW